MKVNKYIQRKSTEQLIGDVLIDAGKLAFGGVVLGGVLRIDTSNLHLIVSGLILCIAFVAIGIYFTNYKK